MKISCCSLAGALPGSRCPSPLGCPSACCRALIEVEHVKLFCFLLFCSVLQNSWGQEAVIYLEKERDLGDLGCLQTDLTMFKHLQDSRFPVLKQWIKSRWSSRSLVSGNENKFGFNLQSFVQILKWDLLKFNILSNLVLLASCVNHCRTWLVGMVVMCC